jgi:transglutaminase-like putative cysteine protease
MSDADAAATQRQDAGRDYGTVALVVVCLGAAVLAAGLLPALSAAGSGSPPAESLVPLPPDERDSGDDGRASGGGGDLGALGAGDRQSVGGSIGNESTFRSLNADVHFTVESDRPGYWRTGAYDTYTGDGWERTADSDVRAPATGATVSYQVTLAQAASSPPTVWRPTSVDGPSGLAVADGVATTETPLPAGTTYSGVSSRPPRDSSVLATSGRDYPEAVEQRYTELPEETAAEIGPHTDRITGNASTPYETAVRVEEWLESNKEYSLTVEPPEDDMARQFVFEMDTGYCEYFATSMVTMLRSQGVPARYVVGYSPGERVGDDSYRVRGMNAHAWVEVYFTDVGWVRFDPTPASDRIERQRQRIEAINETDEYDPPDAGSPTDLSTPDDTPNPDQPQTPDQPPPDETRTPTPARDDSPAVSLNRTAAGSTVAVSVTDGGDPVVDATVTVDGERVGQTDAEGRVVATLPYAETVTVRTSGGQVSGSSDPRGGGPDADDATETVDLDTEGTLAVSGPRRTGSPVVMTATVAGVPVEDATVTVDGERVGSTDDSGRIRVTLPPTPGNVTVRAERGAVLASRTVTLGELTVATDPRLPVPVAGTPVEVTASVGGEPTAGIPVRVGGDTVGTTGPNGTLAATLPAATSVPVVVTTGDQTTRTTVSNPLANLVVLVGTALALVAGGVVAAVGREGGVRDLPTTVRAAASDGARTLVRLCVSVAVAVERLLALAVGRARRTAIHLRALSTGDRSPATLAEALRAWLGSLSGRVTGLSGVVASARTGDAGPEQALDSTGTDGPGMTVREAWTQFLDHVSVADPGTRTPGQLATHAIAVDDLPAEAVRTLRDEFRAVEYGPRDRETAAPTVASAVETIEATGDGGDDTDAASSEAADLEDRSGDEPGDRTRPGVDS